MATKKISSVVSASWLKEHLEDAGLVILNATLAKATDSSAKTVTERIPGARFFDIKNTFSDAAAPFPNTIIGEKIFETEARKLGINENSYIVVYDEYGMYSAARAWYMFRAMGHSNVAVLDGGWPAWTGADRPVEKKSKQVFPMGNFTTAFDPDYFRDYNYLLNKLSDADKKIVDARSENRFKGQAPEPRPGLRGGHIPNSENIPYENLLEKGFLKDTEDLQNIFKDYKNKDELIFSCGSGITACILALGAEISGIKNYSVYDGSWTEWGSLGQLPIERN